MIYRLRTRRGPAAVAGLTVVTGCEMVSEKLARWQDFLLRLDLGDGRGGGSPTPAR